LLFCEGLQPRQGLYWGLYMDSLPVSWLSLWLGQPYVMEALD